MRFPNARCGLLLLSLATRTTADVLVFEEPAPWWSAVGSTQTITFTELPWGTVVTDQYQSTHGIGFTDGMDLVVGCTVGCLDESLLNGVGDIEVEFDLPRSWIAVDYQGLMTLELYADDEMIFTSGFQFWHSDYGLFAGVVSSMPFDQVRLFDFVDGSAYIDKLHFGGPDCTAGGTGGVADTAVTCPGDATWDGLVEVDDLIEVLLTWGPCPSTRCAGATSTSTARRRRRSARCAAGRGPVRGLQRQRRPRRRGHRRRDQPRLQRRRRARRVRRGRGHEPDCNGNGIPDECDTAHGYEAMTPYLSPMGPALRSPIRSRRCPRPRSRRSSRDVQR